MRKVFVDQLPHKGKQVDWNSSIGKLVHFIYDKIEDDITILDYDGKKLKINYLNKEYFMGTSDFKNCKLKTLLGLKSSEFKLEIGTKIIDTKRDMTIIDKKIIKDKNNHNIKLYKYHCNKDNHENWIREYNLLNGNGCLFCVGQSIQLGINDIPTNDPWMIPYFQGGYDEAKLYTSQSNKKIYPICPDCGRVKQSKVIICNIYNNKSIGCSCSDGIKYPNKFGFKMLETLEVDFINEYCPEWIKPKAYDFYFELYDKKYIIEMDGEWHSKNNNMSGQTKEESKAIDDYKDEIAKLNNIEVIRIDCDYEHNNRFEYIKNNILSNKILNELFDLNKIDWNKCNEFASSNRVKEACNYKKNNPNITTTEIGNMMKLHTSTIIKYLKNGNEIGWCEYDARQEKIKSSIKCHKSNCKPIICITNGQKFNSAVECEAMSMKVFGIQLRADCIRYVCNGNTKQHKGLVFKYL